MRAMVSLFPGHVACLCSVCLVRWCSENRVRGEKNDFASELNQTQNKELFSLLMNKLLFLCAEVIVQQMDFHLAPFKPSSLSQL